MMSLRPVFGHHELRSRLAAAARSGRLPASLLLTGPRGVGKQRLALWLAQRMLCDGPDARLETEPCGQCQHCRYAFKLQHPDLHWFFPHEKRKESDPSAEDVRADLADTIEERVKADGLWAASSGMHGLYISTVRALVQSASLRPAMAPRAVFVVGDAERMVQQDGSDAAANAFLKLLEEPPPGTTLILTSSEPGALLPTIRSRVVTVRVAPLSSAHVSEFLDDEAVVRRLGATDESRSDLLARAAGAPGQLLEDSATADAFAAARQLLDAALAPQSPEGHATRAHVAARQGVSKARGAFSDTLDALTVLLHEHVRHTVHSGSERDARRIATAVSVLEVSKSRTQQNITPMLLTAVLLDELSALLSS